MAYEVDAFISENTVMLDTTDPTAQRNPQTGLLGHFPNKRKLRRFPRFYTAAGKAVRSLRVERFRQRQYLSAGPGQDHYDLTVCSSVSTGRLQPSEVVFIQFDSDRLDDHCIPLSRTHLS